MEITLEPGYDDRVELEQLFGEYMDMLLCTAGLSGVSGAAAL